MGVNCACLHQKIQAYTLDLVNPTPAWFTFIHGLPPVQPAFSYCCLFVVYIDSSMLDVASVCIRLLGHVVEQ